MSFILVDVANEAGGSARSGYRSARAAARRTGVFGAAVGLAGIGTAQAGLGPDPTLIGVAVAAAGVAVLWRAATRDYGRWLRGSAAECSTAEVLDGLNQRRWVVRHDLTIPGSGANIDHLVIGPTGVWVLDTKSTRAAVRTRFRRVYFGDRKLDSSPVRWEASVVAEGLGVPVRTLMVVHGHGLPARGGRAGGVRVVPAGALIARLRRGRRRLSPAEVGELSELSARRFASFEKGGPARVSARR